MYWYPTVVILTEPPETTAVAERPVPQEEDQYEKPVVLSQMALVKLKRTASSWVPVKSSSKRVVSVSGMKGMVVGRAKTGGGEKGGGRKMWCGWVVWSSSWLARRHHRSSHLCMRRPCRRRSASTRR
jgi:hypothetical protein